VDRPTVAVRARRERGTRLGPRRARPLVTVPESGSSDATSRTPISGGTSSGRAARSLGGPGRPGRQLASIAVWIHRESGGDRRAIASRMPADATPPADGSPPAARVAHRTDRDVLGSREGHPRRGSGATYRLAVSGRSGVRARCRAGTPRSLRWTVVRSRDQHRHRVTGQGPHGRRRHGVRPTGGSRGQRRSSRILKEPADPR
jgi:hypothetical protein